MQTQTEPLTLESPLVGTDPLRVSFETIASNAREEQQRSEVLAVTNDVFSAIANIQAKIADAAGKAAKALSRIEARANPLSR